jgi:hypothetical protein
MALCSRCQNISFSEPEPYNHEFFPYATFAFLHSTAQALRDSADNCALCARFWEALSHDGRSARLRPLLETRVDGPQNSDLHADAEDLHVRLRGYHETPDNRGVLNHLICVEYKHWSSACRPESPMPRESLRRLVAQTA